MQYLRFQGTVCNRRGTFPGVFGLVNQLAFDGRLNAEQERFRRTTNDWYNANFPNPAHVDPAVYDRALNPAAVAWFKSTARIFIDRVAGYLDILDAHGIDCEMIQTCEPGRIIYEDEFQVIAVPYNPDSSSEGAAARASVARTEHPGSILS